jgi:hypothetical protein
VAESPNWKLTDDRQHMLVLFPTEPMASALIHDAGQVDDLIAGLEFLRRGMIEQVPPTLDPGSRLDSIIGPAWRATDTPDGPVLAFRHPGLGWLGFLLPAEGRRQLGEWLLGTAREPPAP